MAEDVLGEISITRRSTADQVAAVLRERIVRGELRPGTSLREVSMAASIGVSRNTMREAIRVLVHEGLVRHSVHRGVTVTELSESDVRDIYAVRRLLEPAAVDNVNNVNEQLERTSETLDRLAAAVESKNWVEIVENDMRFHRRLVELHGSNRLDNFYRNLLAELRLGLIFVDQSSPDLTKSVAQHRELFDLLSRGKKKDFKDLITSHLSDAEALLLETLKAPSNDS
jgi:DNA-binding GntR family transcriptional regulator